MSTELTIHTYPWVTTDAMDLLNERDALKAEVERLESCFRGAVEIADAREVDLPKLLKDATVRAMLKQRDKAWAERDAARASLEEAEKLRSEVTLALIRGIPEPGGMRYDEAPAAIKRLCASLEETVALLRGVVDGYTETVQSEWDPESGWEKEDCHLGPAIASLAKHAPIPEGGE